MVGVEVEDADFDVENRSHVPKRAPSRKHEVNYFDPR